MSLPAVLALLVSGASQAADTATFADDATAELYFRARVRHIRQDALVRDYTATVRTRFDVALGRSRFARQTTLLAHESVATVMWRRPNDLRLRVLGVRTKAPLARLLMDFGEDVEADMESTLRHALLGDRPWFIPRALGDSIRLMGIPDLAALHPLADEGTAYYRFAIVDSVQVIVPGRTVRAIKMRVQPKMFGPSLIAGDMWIDAETADVVRMRIVFLGEYVWATPKGDAPEDSAVAREENREAERFLSIEAEVEYGLIDRRHWMPHRQYLAITAELPWFLNFAIPVRAVTTFSDYRVNASPDFAFVIPPEPARALREERERRRLKWRDSTEQVSGDRDERRRKRRMGGYYHAGAWRDGWWEVDVPPDDSLVAYEWDRPLRLSLDAAEERRLRDTFAELSKLEQDVPPEWVGKRRFQFALQNLADLIRFNRVQGPALGGAYRLRTGLDFTSVIVSGQFGFGDLRPVGSVTLRRDAPGGRLDVSVYRALQEAEPWVGGLGFGNTLNALLTGHDDADYFLSLGGGFAYTWNNGPLVDMRVGVFAERHRSMALAPRALWGFQPNPSVLEGDFVRGLLAKDGRVGPLDVRAGMDFLTGGLGTAGRGWASLALRFDLMGRSGRLVTRAAVVRGDSLAQLAVRLGGPRTVRGYTYGTRVGRELWTAQLDIAVLKSGPLMPVAFVDVADGFDGDPLVGVGLGLSFLNGLVRFNLAKGIRPSQGLRFDLHFRAPR